MIQYVKFEKSDKKNKRYVAIFFNSCKKKVKQTHFGYKDPETGKYNSTYIDHLEILSRKRITSLVIV